MLAVDNCYFPFHLTKSLIFNYLSVPPQTLSEAFDAFPCRRPRNDENQSFRENSTAFFADLLLITTEKGKFEAPGVSATFVFVTSMYNWIPIGIRKDQQELETFIFEKKSTLFLLCPSLYAFDNGVDTLLWVRSCHFPGAWFIAENYYKKLNWNRTEKKLQNPNRSPFFWHFFSAKWNNRTKGGKCFSFHC